MTEKTSPTLERRFTVLDYEENVLAHRATLQEALDVAVAILGDVCSWEEHLRYWPLFSLSRDPIEGAEQARELEGGLLRSSGLSDATLTKRGVIVDIRDMVASDPRLDINGAASSIYEVFRNIDLCSVAYRDTPLLFEWPKDRVNHVAAFDPALERALRERYAGTLADGVPVHAVLERTRLTHVDELHMWVFSQIFYFHACKLGQYKEPPQVYGFSGSRFRKNMVLAWGCAPHAHEMAWGIAYGIDKDLAVTTGEEIASCVRLEPRFVEQVEALLEPPPAAPKKVASKKAASPKAAPKKAASKSAK